MGIERSENGTSLAVTTAAEASGGVPFFCEIPLMASTSIRILLSRIGSNRRRYHFLALAALAVVASTRFYSCESLARVPCFDEAGAVVVVAVLTADADWVGLGVFRRVACDLDRLLLQRGLLHGLLL